MARESLRGAGIDTVCYAETRVEPSDASFQEAIRAGGESRCDGFAAVGGGSSMDTAKAANLYTTYPAELLTYVNHPIGRGKPVPGSLKPLVAVPTTAGTGSETTGWRYSTTWRWAPRPGSPIARCGPPSASSTPTTPVPCPRWWRPAAGWTCSVTPWSRSPRCPIRRARRRQSRRCARPTRVPTRSATCGPSAPSSWWRSTWCARYATRTTARRAPPCCWPPPSPDTATPACTCRTVCPTRCPAWWRAGRRAARATIRPATPTITPCCRTACR